MGQLPSVSMEASPMTFPLSSGPPLFMKAFRGPITTAINQELNRIRRNGIVGQPLLKLLSDIFHQHSMRDLLDRHRLRLGERPAPKVICSEALL